MMIAILPLFAAALSTGASLGAGADVAPVSDPPVIITAPRTAQVQLAVTLSEADAIHAVTARARAGRTATIVFAIDRDGQTYELVATTRAKGAAKGEVIALTITGLGPAIGGPGNLSWLGAELIDATAVTALSSDEDGAVTITTSDGRAYMAIPGRGSGGNAAVEARWAAAWDRTDG